MFSVKIWIFWITCLIVGVRALQLECPEPENTYPCYCEEEEDDDLPILYCNHLLKLDQIQKAMRGLDGHKMHQISFIMNSISDPLNSDAFKNVAVEKLQFFNSSVTIVPPQFQGLENHLKSIELRAMFNDTNPIGSWSLGHLKNLKELTLTKNNMRTLPTNWLTSVPDSLTSLFVEDNTIITLEDEVFAKAKHLVFMVLDSNRIAGLKRNVFPNPAPSLRSLTLNYNKLRYLPYDLFDNMPSLRIVEMTNNRLTVLENNIWANVYSQLTKLDFSDNALQCDSTLKWMFKSLNKPFLLYGECAVPERLRGKSIKRLREEDIK